MGGLLEADGATALMPVAAGQEDGDVWLELDVNSDIMPREAELLPADAPDLLVTVLSPTDLRLTVTNSTGTVRSFYATASSKGDEWTEGPTRAGDGDIDITPGNGTYYLWVISDNGMYSLPSSVWMVRMLATGGTYVMFLGFPRLVSGERTTREKSQTIEIEELYELGPGQTLAEADLEPGDALPGDAEAEILKSRYQRVANSVALQARVWARKDREWED